MNYQDYHDMMPSDIITKLNKEYSAKNINVMHSNSSDNSFNSFVKASQNQPENNTDEIVPPTNTQNIVNNNAIYFNITYLLNCLINHIDLMIKHTQMPDRRLTYSNYLGIINNQYKYFSGLLNNQIISCPPAKFITFTKLKCDIARLELEVLQQFNLLVKDTEFDKVLLQQFIREHLDFLQEVN